MYAYLFNAFPFDTIQSYGTTHLFMTPLLQV